MFPEKPPRRRTYLWQRPDWPQWRFDAAALAAPLAQVHRAQGHLAGRMAELGLAQRDQATLQALTQEVITTSAIEGEALNLDAVRSSIARRLGVDIGALAPADRHVDGVVDMVLDATQQHAHLAGLSEIAPVALLNIFEKLQTAKSRQVFVAMAFRDETKATFKAIQDAIDDVNRDHHLGLLPIKPIRIDEFDTWRSHKITDSIMEQIEECGLVIADLTYGNANVYHEIGYLFGLNTAQQRTRIANLILIWHKDRSPMENEDKKKIEANDVRFDLKDWSAIRLRVSRILCKRGEC